LVLGNMSPMFSVLGPRGILDPLNPPLLSSNLGTKSRFLVG
jgi:hypothetical protein